MVLLLPMLKIHSIKRVARVALLWASNKYGTHKVAGNTAMAAAKSNHPR